MGNVKKFPIQGYDVNLPKPPKRGKKWTLCFVGDQGRLIPIKRFKILAVPVLIALLVAGGSAYGLYRLYLKSNNTHAELLHTLQKFEKQIDTLEKQNDNLIARLVLARTKFKKSQTPPAPQRVTQPPVMVKPESRPHPAPPVLPVKILQSRDRKPIPELPLFLQSHVAIENFNVQPEPDTGRLHVNFKLKNVAAARKPIAGHVFTMFIRQDLEPNSIPTLPVMRAQADKSSPLTNGQTFSISHFKTVRFEIPARQTYHDLKKARILVYTKNGELLLEQTFPVDIKAEAGMLALKRGEGDL